MAIIKDIKKGNSKYTRLSIPNIATNIDAIPRGKSAPLTMFYELEPAEVIDIILDENHKSFKSWTDIGKIKFRFVTSQNGVDENHLAWAKPLESNIKNYPLKHEIVIIAEYVSTIEEAETDIEQTSSAISYYYFQRMNIFNAINNNAFSGISLDKLSENDKLGDFFNDDRNKINPLFPYEGDIILEGRFGNSVRLGQHIKNAKKTSPRICISCGRTSNNNSEWPISHIDENIDSDSSSLWMINDTLNFTKSSNISKWLGDKNLGRNNNGKQIILNSDRLIFNTRVNEFIVYSKGGIGFSTLGNTIFDTSKDFCVSANKIYLGYNAEEPVVLGNKLKGWLSDLIDTIIKETHPTGTGPSGIPINIANYTSLKSKLMQLLSKTNFTT